MHGWIDQVVAVKEVQGGDVLEYQSHDYLVNDTLGGDMYCDILTSVGRCITLKPNQRVRIKRYAR